jgi:hypothetical protein
MSDFLRLAVFIDGEVFLPETRYEAAFAVGDRRCDIDQLDATLEADASLLLAGNRRSCAGCPCFGYRSH